MSKIHVSEITDTIAKMSIDANYYLNDDILNKFLYAKENETNESAKYVIDILLENAEIARTQKMPMCQDTGMAVVFVEMGQEVEIVGGSLTEAINKGVAKGYEEGYLRKSVVRDPIDRVNTGDNTPAVIHYDIVPGNELKMTIAPKGFGSENMSQLKMLVPADGIEGVKQFVLDTVLRGGGNPCPPLVVGIGVGGTMEKAALNAKKSLLREVGVGNEDPAWDKVEQELLEEINKTGIGPAGLGGDMTAMAVHIVPNATHIAGLPVAVNICCHAARHVTEVLGGDK